MDGAGTSPSRWDSLLRVGAAAAYLIAALLLGEIAVFAVLPRPASALEHFELLQRDPLAGLLTLDLLGMLAYLLFIPVLLALYVVVRRASETLGAIAMVLFVIGVADFFATNTAFPALALSQQYASASSESERAAALAAGEAMFALFNENAFLVSYVIVSASWVVLGAAMLRSPWVGRGVAFAAILAGAAGVLAVVLEHAAAVLVAVAIPIYFAAILFLLVWMLLLGRILHRLAAEEATFSGP